jgi:hypothetical protein
MRCSRGGSFQMLLTLPKGVIYHAPRQATGFLQTSGLHFALNDLVSVHYPIYVKALTLTDINSPDQSPEVLISVRIKHLWPSVRTNDVILV